MEYANYTKLLSEIGEKVGLDDVADRKEVFVYPPVTVADAVVRPYYTVDNDLSVEVRRTGSTLAR